MNELCAVDGSPLAPESLRMLEYLQERAAEMNTAAIRARIAAAVHDLEEVVATVSVADARLRPFVGRLITGSTGRRGNPSLCTSRRRYALSSI